MNKMASSSTSCIEARKRKRETHIVSESPKASKKTIHPTLSPDTSSSKTSDLDDPVSTPPGFNVTQLSDNSPSSSESNNSESGESSQRNIPEEISSWSEENLTTLSIVTTFQEETTPLDLLKTFPPSWPYWKIPNAWPRYIEDIEEYFHTFCDFHVRLDHDIDSVTSSDADVLLKSERYISTEFMRVLATREDCTEEKLASLREWFDRFENNKMRFGRRLDNVLLKEKLRHEEDSFHIDSTTEYDYQCLFEAFASIFGLQDYGWSEPLMPRKVLELSQVQAVGKADILYCQDFKSSTAGKLSQNMRIVAVCKAATTKDVINNNLQGCTERVKKHLSGTNQQDYRKARSSRCSSSTDKCSKIPPHINFGLLGQHGGELLLYFDQTAHEDVIFGLIVQKTKVTFTALKMTRRQYESIISGRYDQPSAQLIITKPYDFMKKEDRVYLIRPLLELALMQELKDVPKHEGQRQGKKTK